MVNNATSASTKELHLYDFYIPEDKHLKMVSLSFSEGTLGMSRVACPEHKVSMLLNFLSSSLAWLNKLECSTLF
jgi:hypothetical protein